jgi:hypothetical protein
MPQILHLENWERSVNIWKTMAENNKPQFLEKVFIHHQDRWVMRVHSHDLVSAPVSVEV